MEVTAEKMQKMVAYVEKTQPIVKEAAELDAKVAERAPAVVDALIKAGTIDETSRERATESLKNPLKALESLEKIAKRLEKEAEDAPPKPMGKSEKRAAQTTFDGKPMKESDRVYLEGMGLI